MRLAVLFLLAAPLAAQQRTPDPKLLIRDAIGAMGGDAVLRAASPMRLQGAQVDYQQGNAERAEGPWRMGVSNYSELRDVLALRTRRSANGFANPVPSVTVLTDSVTVISSAGRSAIFQTWREDALDRVDGDPVRALLLASEASAPRWDGRVLRYGIAHDVVSFPHRSGRMRLELSRDSHLPTAVELLRVHPIDFRKGIFGDAVTRAELRDWQVEANGLWYPHQIRTFFDGDLQSDVSVAAFATGVAAPADSFAVSDSLRAAWTASAAMNFDRIRVGSRGTLPDLAPGIVRLRDQWATTLVKQDDGVVIFEAHIGAGYFESVLADIEKRWPGAKVKAVVLTSDPWAHLGGVRQAVSHGIPIYVSGRSIPFLTALVKRPWTLAPDDLARRPRAPKFVAVDGRTTIGTGENAIALYPVGGPYGERMTMAYFPARRILYGADLVFPDRAAPKEAGPRYLRTEAWDLRAAVAREGLAVDTLFCVQPTIPPVAWRDFVPTGVAPR